MEPHFAASRRVRCVLALLSFLISACGGDGGDGGTGPSPVVRKKTIELLVTPGVVRVAGPDALEIDSGTVVRYEFQLSTGYEHLKVLLDGKPVANAGSFTINKNVILVAAADRIINVPAGDSVLKSAATRLVSGGNVMDAYRKLAAYTAAVAQTDGPAEAARRLRLAYTASLKPVRDAAAFARAWREIADSLAASSTARSIARNVLASSNAASGPRTTFMYVNGINTTSADASLTTYSILAPMISSIGYVDRTMYPVDFVANRSGKWLGNGFMDALACLDLEAAAWSNSPSSGLDDQVRCIDVYGSVFGIGADLGQSIAQFLNITVSRWPAEADPEARRLADAIAASSASNGRVVVIAHSQGNLMAGEALGILKNRAGFDTRCLGFVSIAPPASIPVAGTGATLNSMIIDGVFVDDVLLLLPTTPLAIGSTPRVTNALSRFYDAFSVLYLLQPYGSLLRAYAGLQLHSIDGSYLTEDGTRERTVTALQTVSSAVNASCPTPRVKSVSVEPNVAILAPSKTVRATATVNADAGVAQTVTWQSSNTTVATVDATGLITAKTIGTAVITAASTVDPTVTGSLALTVRPIQAAVVSIQTITVADNPTIPVNLGNVSGSIDVNLLIDSGDETVTGAGIYLDGVEVNRSNLTITGLRSLVLSFNTGALGPTTGRLRFCNGPHTLSTKIFVQDGPALGVAGPTASMTFNNSGPACSGSSPTVLFTDNFSSGLGGWTIRGTGGSWTTANGVVTGVYDYVCGSSGCSQSQLVLNTDIAALSSWSAEIRFTQSFYAKYNRYLAQAALILWVSENEKTQLGVAEGATGSPLPATLSQIGYSVQRFPWTQLAGARPNVSSWVPAAWNTLKISKSANEYRLYFNDQLLTTQTLSFSAPPKIGLSVYGQSVFDDFKLVTP